MTTTHSPAGPAWRKSSHSGSSNNCVEVATRASGVTVRDSKNPGGPRLAFSSRQWRSFITGMQTSGLAQG